MEGLSDKGRENWYLSELDGPEGGLAQSRELAAAHDSS
jgi:hypothetical protein